MNHLLYLSYGHGPHELETRYSMLSARQALRRHGGECQIVLYTDDPQANPGKDISVRFIEADELQQWSGPSGFKHRRKLAVLRDALTTLPGPVALMDSDTYFRKSPALLFDRIGPGRSVLHRKEGHLDKWQATAFADYLATNPTLLHRNGTPWACSPDTPMWNSGVVGMHPADIELVEEMIFLTDQLYPPTRSLGAEQFSAGVVLTQSSKLSECMDLVFHYWLMDQRQPFRAAMEEAFARSPDDVQVHQQLLPLQPVDSAFEVGKLRFKRLLEAAGLYKERR